MAKILLLTQGVIMTGQVIFGDKYFSRPKDEERVWRRLKRGGHLLLLAPRRVGKTSLLRSCLAKRFLLKSTIFY
jgi:predicted AAA+ superfamily ATPase